MSKNIESYSLKMDMREDLMRCYREVAPTCLTQHAAWEKTIAHPARRFYITAKQVAQILSVYLSGNEEPVNRMKPPRKRMYKCLAERIIALSNTPEFQGKSLSSLVREVINQPAPEFFISARHMRMIFFHIKKHNYNTDGQLIYKPKVHIKDKPKTTPKVTKPKVSWNKV